jgi:hypothetical protein
MPYAEVFEGVSAELRLVVARLVDALKAGSISGARRDELRVQYRSGGGADATETRLEELAAAGRPARPGWRNWRRPRPYEARLEELAARDARTRLEELAAAGPGGNPAGGTGGGGSVPGAPGQVNGRSRAVTQKRTQDRRLFRRTFQSQVGGLGERWGLQTEEAFRHGIRTILNEVGFTTERFLTWDASGEVFDHPEQVELDVVVQNGKVVVVEIKSALDRANTYLFNRKVEFYTRQTGHQVDRKVVVAPYADERAKEVAQRLGIEVCTDVAEFK